MHWFKGKFTGKHHILLENQWFSGKIYGLLGKSMVSWKFSLNPLNTPSVNGCIFLGGDYPTWYNYILRILKNHVYMFVNFNSENHDTSSGQNYMLKLMPCANLGRPLSVVRSSVLPEVSQTGYGKRVVPYQFWGSCATSERPRRSKTTWWFIPLSKWVITPVISGLTPLIPFITRVVPHLLSGMSHQVVLQ